MKQFVNGQAALLVLDYHSQEHRRRIMALQSRIRELDSRHRDLDLAIEHEARRPAVDTIRLMEMKRQKLKIKEQIDHLRRAAH